MLPASPSPKRGLCHVTRAAPSRRSYAKGLARSIGVSNLCKKALACVLETAKVTPMIHYIMVSD